MNENFRLITLRVNPEATELADYRSALEEYLTVDGPNQLFVKSEVSILGALQNEKILPGQGYPTTVLIGRWYRCQDEQLFVRCGKNNLGDSLALANYGNSPVSDRWFYSVRANTRAFEDARGRLTFEDPRAYSYLTFAELQRAAQLTAEFSATLESYMRMQR